MIKFKNISKEDKQKVIDRMCCSKIFNVRNYRYINRIYRKDDHIFKFISNYGIYSIFSTKFGKLISDKQRNDFEFLKKCIKEHVFRNFYLNEKDFPNLFKQIFVEDLLSSYHVYLRLFNEQKPKDDSLLFVENNLKDLNMCDFNIKKQRIYDVLLYISKEETLIRTYEILLYYYIKPLIPHYNFIINIKFDESEMRCIIPALTLLQIYNIRFKSENKES
jgi:hypothetical protein